ncbi:MAG: site-2 protease family protein, partial [Eubacterium sp.]|nr:site-2 protease family protein [Eubacterium sp.]
ERDGKEQVLTVHPQKSAEENRYIMGFEHNSKAQSAGFLGTIKYSAYEVKFWIQTTVKSLGMMIKGQVSKDDISGPVGIVKTMGESVEEGNKEGGVGQAAANLLLMCILLSANLGVMNLIPIPALDGGRLLFLFIELIRRKPLPQKFENYVNVAGFALLMGLMVFIMANDILKIFR